MELQPLDPGECPFVCATCGAGTTQSPVRLGDVVYPSCCYPCFLAHKWSVAIPVEYCGGDLLAKAEQAPLLSRSFVSTQFGGTDPAYHIMKR